MQNFETIFQRAANRHGGEDAFREKLASHYYGVNTASLTEPKSDDRWLSEFSKRIFQAGFNWTVVENKWDGFEKAFWNFDPGKCSGIDMDDMERLTSDKAIVRNPVKIKTVLKNADMILGMAAQAGRRFYSRLALQRLFRASHIFAKTRLSPRREYGKLRASFFWHSEHHLIQRCHGGAHSCRHHR